MSFFRLTWILPKFTTWRIVTVSNKTWYHKRPNKLQSWRRHRNIVHEFPRPSSLSHEIVTWIMSHANSATFNEFIKSRLNQTRVMYEIYNTFKSKCHETLTALNIAGYKILRLTWFWFVNPTFWFSKFIYSFHISFYFSNRFDSILMHVNYQLFKTTSQKKISKSFNRIHFQVHFW